MGVACACNGHLPSARRQHTHELLQTAHAQLLLLRQGRAVGQAGTQAVARWIRGTLQQPWATLHAARQAQGLPLCGAPRSAPLQLTRLTELMERAMLTDTSRASVVDACLRQGSGQGVRRARQGVSRCSIGTATGWQGRLEQPLTAVLRLGCS